MAGMTTKTKKRMTLDDLVDSDDNEKRVDEPVTGAEADEEEEEEEESEVNDGQEDEDDEEEADSDASAGNDEYPAADSDADEAEDAVEGEEEEELEAVGFGDAMSKILQQSIGDDAQPILAKRTTARMREIMNEKKEIKKERISAAEKRAMERKDNVVPTHATAVKDRQLRKIATKGVVALFNAIAKHQHQTGKVTDKDDKKVKGLTKEGFLGLLKGTQKDKAASAVDASATAASSSAAKSSWSVLQDDYMMGAKMKDWDATHNNNESSRSRRRGDADHGDDSDPEAAEDKAWKQAAVMGSEDDEDDDNDDNATSKSNKRKAAGTKGHDKAKKKKVQRS